MSDDLDKAVTTFTIYMYFTSRWAMEHALYVFHVQIIIMVIASTTALLS